MSPALILTQGDPASIGPDIALMASQTPGAPVFTYVGCAKTLHARAQQLGLVAPPFPILDVPLDIAITAGQPDPAYGAQVMRCLDIAIDAVTSGRAQALITNPIAKSVLYAAGFNHPGQTEYVADRVKAIPFAGARGPVMMLAAPGLRVALATIHTPLRTVADALTVQGISHTIAVVHAALQRDFGIQAPRIAVCGLNPHAGEDGALGAEEIEIITPACDAARAKGWAVHGPLPADTLFHPERRADFDAHIAMYHDQGLIPLKMLDFWGGVNVSLGLPIVRTSPDHGTAFDRAGTGTAQADSLIAALHLAASIAARRAT
jgi:4-hydroxythreonine-4-phosphate dehydrogenase